MSAFKYEPVGTHFKETLTASVHTPSAPAGDVDGLHVSVTTAAVMYTYDGDTDPTSTTGHPIAVGGTVVIPYTVGKMPRFFGNTAVLNMTWLKIVKGT